VAKTRVADKGAQGPSRSRAVKEWGKKTRTIPNVSQHGGTVKRSESKGKEAKGRQAGRERREGDSRIRVNKNAALHEHL